MFLKGSNYEIRIAYLIRSEALRGLNISVGSG